MSSSRRDTDSPLADPAYVPPPPDNLPALRHIADSIHVPFAFSHVTAAHILAWPMPWRSDVTRDIHVISDSSLNQVRRPGFIGHRGLESREITFLHGLPVITPAHTWTDLGELVGLGRPFGLDDIIAAGDQALNSGCTHEQLRSTVESRVRPRGKRTLIPAIPVCARGAESRPETFWRLAIRRARLPSPVLNRNVYDANSDFLFRPDASWPAKKVATEYQGKEWHDDPASHEADGRRMAMAKRHGWTVLEVRSEHLWQKASRDAALRQLADALDFPQSRLDLAMAEPQFFSAESAATLAENLERRLRRERARFAGGR